MVAVSYRQDKDDVRAALGVVARSLPARRKLKRTLLVLAGAGLVVFVIGVAAGTDDSIFFPLAGFLLVVLSLLLRSDRYFAWAILRSDVGKSFLLQDTERSFRADATGLTFTTPTSTGTQTWAAVADIVDDPAAVVLLMTTTAFYFVPGDVLTAADRTTLHALRKTAK